MAIFQNLKEQESDLSSQRHNFNLLNTFINKKEKVHSPYSAYFNITQQGQIKETVCLNFESKIKQEDWMSLIIEQKQKYGDASQVSETLQLAIRFGIKSRSSEKENQNSDHEDESPNLSPQIKSKRLSTNSNKQIKKLDLNKINKIEKIENSDEQQISDVNKDKCNYKETYRENQKETIKENLDTLGQIMDSSFMIDEDNEEDLSDIINYDYNRRQFDSIVSLFNNEVVMEVKGCMKSKLCDNQVKNEQVKTNNKYEMQSMKLNQPIEDIVDSLVNMAHVQAFDTNIKFKNQQGFKNKFNDQQQIQNYDNKNYSGQKKIFKENIKIIKIFDQVDNLYKKQWIINSFDENVVQIQLFVYSYNKYKDNSSQILNNLEKFINKIKLSTKLLESNINDINADNIGFQNDFENQANKNTPQMLDQISLQLNKRLTKKELFSENNHTKSNNNQIVSTTKSQQIIYNYQQMEKQEGHFIRDNTNGKLMFIRRDIEKDQMNIINRIIQQAGAGLMVGKINIMNISLPVALFAKYTMLEKDAYIVRTFPKMIALIRGTPDPVLKLSQFLAFKPLVINYNIAQYKPFNPQWGETQQTTLGELDISVEQVLHHPPISMVQVANKDKSVVFHSQQNTQANFGISVSGRNFGREWMQIDKDEFRCEVQPNQIFGNFIIGSRQFHLKNRQLVQSPTLKLVGIIFQDINECFDSFWPKDQFDKVWGCIVTCNSEEEFKEFMKVDKHTAFKYTFGSRIQAEITGNWTTSLDLVQTLNKTNNVENTSVSRIKLYDIESEIQAWPMFEEIEEMQRLPSCSTKREDLQIWMTDDELNADACKVKLENIQRKDRKLRDKDHTFFVKRDII